MVKRILVPLDGSSLAEMALDAAALLARRFAAEIVLVRVIPAEASGAFSKTIHSRPATEAHTYLDRVARRLREEEVAVSTAVLPGGPAAGITQEAVLGHVDLMVMTPHGRKGLETLLHPSITWQVLTQTEVPLLACQCGEGEEPGRLHLSRFMTDPLAPLLVPLDGSLQAESALPLAEVLARTFGNPLVLVRAVEPVYSFGMEANPQTVDEVMQAALAEAQRYLLHQQDAPSRAGLLVLLALGEDEASHWIETCVRAWRAGLVVMASHGRRGVDQLVLGSVARRVLSHVQAPLLLVRSSALEERDTAR
jgi:nucleotide-binding universal stress UspA family protein